jgi:hypothetical protein
MELKVSYSNTKMVLNTIHVTYQSTNIDTPITSLNLIMIVRDGVIPKPTNAGQRLPASKLKLQTSPLYK